MNITPEEERFYKNSVVLAEAIHDCVEILFRNKITNVNPVLVKMGILVLNSYKDSKDKHDLIKKFITHSNMHWDKIRVKDEEFFINNADSVFTYFSSGEVSIYKQLFTNNVIPEQTKQDIWRLLSSMTIISLKYIKKNDLEIDIKEHLIKWEIPV